MKTKNETLRVNGLLKEITTILDEEGKILHKIVSPMMVEFTIKDILQVIIGAVLIAIPMSFSEELWTLGIELDYMRIAALALTSMFFNAIFIYQANYKGKLKKHLFEFLKRIIFTYGFSILISIFFLYLLDKFPYGTDPTLAIKRSILIAFPASLGGALADSIK